MTKIDYAKVADVVAAIQGLNDTELMSVVSSLSSDYHVENNISSTMGALCYVFTTSYDDIICRKGTIRYQATQTYAKKGK